MVYNTFFKPKKYTPKQLLKDGAKYDSNFEAQIGNDLEKRKKAKEIKDYIKQFKVELRAYGQLIANYYVDFKVIHNDLSVEYIEVKGLESPVWLMKWRLFEAQTNELEPGATLTVIKQSNNYRRRK